MGDKKYTIDVSWVWSVIVAIIAIVLGILESGHWVGGVVAFAVVFLCLIACLIGLIPIIGPLIYFFILNPTIVNWITSFYPNLNLPLTLGIILILTTCLSVLYTIVAIIAALIVVSQ